MSSASNSCATEREAGAGKSAHRQERTREREVLGHPPPEPSPPPFGGTERARGRAEAARMLEPNGNKDDDIDSNDDIHNSNEYIDI